MRPVPCDAKRMDSVRSIPYFQTIPGPAGAGLEQRPRFLEHQRLGLAPYQDSFHPSALGQRLIAVDLELAIRKARDERLRNP